MTLSELRRHRLIQGHDWPDLEILEYNGFQVEATANYESIVLMLSHSRVTLLPRSIIEVWEEQAAHSDLGITVETTKLLIYPSAIYFLWRKILTN